MNIYQALQFGVPIIAYSALHQVRKGVPVETYVATMKDFHRLLREQTESIRKSWEAFRTEAATRSVQSARSLLTQFLSTPLKSDADDIQRILRERLEEYESAVSGRLSPGLLATAEGRVIEPAATPAFRKLAVSGRKFLTETGFRTTKTATDIFESVFIIEGSGNLDVLEHMVRDRIGIYTPVHGKHIGEFDAYSYNAHNLVHLRGDLNDPSPYEAALWFSKGGVKYDVFRSTLKEGLESRIAGGEIPHASLWQRKLGLGSGREFIMRLRGNDLGVLCETVAAMQAGEKQKYVRSALQGSHLVCKEMMPV